MDRFKLERQLKKFEEHMMVDNGLSDITVQGYCRALSIALRRMRKFCPDYGSIKELILWMYKEKYSYSHIVNTSLALECPIPRSLTGFEGGKSHINGPALGVANPT